MGWQVEHAETQQHLERYLGRLELPTDMLRVTTDRRTYEGWLGRRIRSTIGGAYLFDSRSSEHLVLINLPRINVAHARSLEVVVAEELIHMRDRIDGDLRRHAKHGYDRIAVRVAKLTGATMDEIRAATIPAKRRPARFLYRCPGCGAEVPRRSRGTWSCGRCAPTFDPRFLLHLVATR